MACHTSFHNAELELTAFRACLICPSSLGKDYGLCAPLLSSRYAVFVDRTELVTLEGARVPLIDGGVVANNPTACAIAEGVRINSSSSNDKEPCQINDFIIASFGTGESTRPISIAESLEWGALEWSLPMIDVLFDGSADAFDYIASQLVDPGNYFRFQVRLEDAYDDMDNADRTNLNALIRIANQYLESDGQGNMKRLVKRLKEIGPREPLSNAP